MAFKDLLVHIDQTPASSGRLEAAITLAEAFGAHLTALCLVPDPYLPPVVGVHIPTDLLRQQRAEAEREADALLQAASEAAARRGVNCELRRELGTLDRLPAMLARQARHADLTIVGQPSPEREGVDEALIAEASFMDTGRPALLIPHIGPRTMPPQRVIAGWDGSREASRAINDSLPLLHLAKDVIIMIVDAEKLGPALGQQPGADVATHLARHGIKVDVKHVHGGGLATADVILSQASDEGADLLVMGGYGHSRFREMVLGGVTRHMLDHMTVPVFFSR